MRVVNFCKVLALAGLFAAAVLAVQVLVPPPPPARAQLSAAGTWIPASGVSGTNTVSLTLAGIGGMADLLGVPVRFIPLNANAAGATNVNFGFGNVQVKRASGGALVPIAGGDFSTTAFAEIIYDGTQAVQTNPATGSEPVGTEIVFSGIAAQIPAGYLIEDGRCVSQTTYSGLYTAYGSTDTWSPGSTGGACAGGSFHLKYANGRASVAVNTQGVATGPLTNCTAGIAIPCGNPTQALSSTGQLPLFTPSGTVASSISPTQTVTSGTGIQTGGSGLAAGAATVTSTFTGVAIGSASPSSFSIINPNTQNYFLVKY